jgi:hypothetical protein
MKGEGGAKSPLPAFDEARRVQYWQGIAETESIEHFFCYSDSFHSLLCQSQRVTGDSLTRFQFDRKVRRFGLFAKLFAFGRFPRTRTLVA